MQSGKSGAVPVRNNGARVRSSPNQKACCLHESLLARVHHFAHLENTTPLGIVRINITHLKKDHL